MHATLRGHQRIDRRSLALHRAIADKLRNDPSLLAIAVDNLARWSQTESGSQPYWDAWRDILSRPMPEILRLLVEDGEHMTALRQASPFAGGAIADVEDIVVIGSQAVLGEFPMRSPHTPPAAKKAALSPGRSYSPGPTPKTACYPEPG